MKKTMVLVAMMIVSVIVICLGVACGDDSADSCLRSFLERACRQGPNDPDECATAFEDATCDNTQGGCATECCD